MKDVSIKKNNAFIYPNKKQLYVFIEDLFEYVFIQRGIEISPYKEEELKEKFQEIIAYEINDKKLVAEIAQNFWETINRLSAVCLQDAKAIFEFDPAAESIDEIIQVYPGFFAIAVYRFAHFLWNNTWKLSSRMISEYVHSKTGIDIHPAAKIGNSFAIDHGTGIVIGATTIIGNNVKLYQGVTLGALQVSKNLRATKRHPTIENNVVIYANATILGGDTIIGANSVVGGNVWITKSISANSLVYHKSEIIIKEKHDPEEPLNFII